MSIAPINNWTIRHDGTTWWTEREGDEAYAATSYLDAASYAVANPPNAPKLVTIPEPVAKYLLAVLFDPSGATNPASDRMAVYSRERLAAALFGDNAEFVSETDASQLHVEALRETVWTTDRP